MRTLLIVLTVLLVGCGEAHPDLPPGYTIQTDGTQYRWVDETGSAAVFSRYNYRATVDYAWEFYRYKEDKKTRQWRNITGVAK